MSRRREPPRETLPPPELDHAEIGGGAKSVEDPLREGPPAQDFYFQADGTAIAINRPGDTTPANDTHW